ncbi:MAG: hypothetical protein FJ125_10365, partial [Deltaproteobacteria bacterium]|nr:hypothetical protein [Deltaproteobacteria bacterium]
MSPPRDIAYHERVSLLQGTVQSILPQLHKGEEFRWTSRLKALLLEGLGRLERGGSPEDEGGMEGLLLLYGKAVDLWCREQSEQPLPAPYARQRTLVHRAGDRLWALRAQRLQP